MAAATDVTAVDLVWEGREPRLRGVSEHLLSLPPWSVYSILTSTEGRDIFRVEKRRVVQPPVRGVFSEEVTLLAPLRVLFWKAWARTTLAMETDATQPDTIRVAFRLIRGDTMTAFDGTWVLQALRCPDTGRLQGTRFSHAIVMWPKGMPSSLRFMPGIVGTVKEVVASELLQIARKLRWIESKVMAGNTCVAQALRQASAEVRSAGSFKRCMAGGQEAGLAGSKDAPRGGGWDADKAPAAGKLPCWQAGGRPTGLLAVALTQASVGGDDGEGAGDVPGSDALPFDTRRVVAVST